MKRVVRGKFFIVVLALVAILVAGCSMKKNKKADSINKILATGSFETVLVNANSSDINVQTGKKYQVKYRGLKKAKPSVEIKNGQLFVKQTNNVNSKNNLSEIIITIPKNATLSQLEVKADEGDIKATGVKMNLGQLKSEEGDLNLESIRMSSGQLSSEEGDLTVKNSQIKKGLHINSDEGDIATDGTKFTGYDLSTEEGSIALHGDSYASSSYKKHAHTKNVLVAKSEEGDITVK